MLRRGRSEETGVECSFSWINRNQDVGCHLKLWFGILLIISLISQQIIGTYQPCKA